MSDFDLILPGWERASHWERFRAVDRCKTVDKIPLLFRCLKDTDSEIRGLAAYALHELGNDVCNYLDLPEFIAVLDSPDDEIRAAALDALSYPSVELNSQAIQIGIVAVADEGVQTQSAARMLLGLASSGWDGMGPLLRALEQPRRVPQTSHWSGDLIDRAFTNFKEAIELCQSGQSLLPMIRQSEPVTRRRAAAVVGADHGDIDAAALKSAAADPDPTTRRAAHSVLSKIDPFDHFYEVQNDPDSIIRVQAIRMLPAAAVTEVIADVLVKGTRDDSSGMREACLGTLGKNPALATHYGSELVLRLNDDSLEVRYSLIHLLEKCFPERQGALLWLSRAVDEPLGYEDAKAVWHALTAESSTDLVDALNRLLASENEYLRCFGVEAGLLAPNLPPELRTRLAALHHAIFEQRMENWRLRGDPDTGPLFPETT
jgi:HEAT repeat protein